MKRINVAIDGYSSCGKSTLAKALASRLHYVYVDTGAMYRAITLHALRKRLFSNDTLDEKGLIDELPNIDIDFEHNSHKDRSEIILNREKVEEEIRTMEVSGKVSKVAPVPEVRRKLVRIQKAMGEKKGVVMDGRDIGTVVLPDAEVKIFMTAENEVRAKRRYDELVSKGYLVTLEEVKKNIEERDHEDTHREESPLTRADDAHVIDNTDLTPEEQLEKALSLVQKAIDGIREE